MDISPVSPLDQSPRSELAKPSSLAIEFETMVLTGFVETMLPDGEAIYGSGMGAELWKSQLASVVAAQLARSGQFGLAEHLGIAE